LQPTKAEERKHFFFEKKKQKTFGYWSRAGRTVGSKLTKVFWFFFSKKNCFLSLADAAGGVP
jgi:hypothetical protein